MDSSSYSNDPQALLASALENNNLTQFQEALDQNALACLDEPYDGISVFEKACSKPGSSKFIQLCIESGCDVNKVISESVKYRFKIYVY